MTGINVLVELASGGPRRPLALSVAEAYAITEALAMQMQAPAELPEDATLGDFMLACDDALFASSVHHRVHRFMHDTAGTSPTSPYDWQSEGVFGW